MYSDKVHRSCRMGLPLAARGDRTETDPLHLSAVITVYSALTLLRFCADDDDQPKKDLSTLSHIRASFSC